MHWLHLPAGRIPAFLNKAVTPTMVFLNVWPGCPTSPLLHCCLDAKHTRPKNNSPSNVATSCWIDRAQMKWRDGSELRRTVSQDEIAFLPAAVGEVTTSRQKPTEKRKRYRNQTYFLKRAQMSVCQEVHAVLRCIIMPNWLRQSASR